MTRCTGTDASICPIVHRTLLVDDVSGYGLWCAIVVEDVSAWLARAPGACCRREP